jgi:hypothetical protein
MSDYIDKFIKQHREYFKRNGLVIENNVWDKEYDLSKKTKLFKQENELTTSIVGRLSAFIKGAEADRKLTKTQKFIDETLKIINLHINKCDTYLDYKMEEFTESSDDTEEEIDLKNQEISFQDDVFTKKISIQDKIDSLNIKFSAEDLKFRFYNDQIASLPMASVLTVVNNDIKEATLALKLKKEIGDKTFYTELLKKGKVKEWNEKKHYWEQNTDVLDFWQNEWLKVTKGFETDGYFIHPWLYWHINFFKTPIPQDDGSEPIVSPDFRDNEWLFVEEIKRAEEIGNQGVMLYGSRRLGKSTLMSSYSYWKALTKPNSSATVTSGSEGDLIDLTHKIKTAMKYTPRAFYLYIQSQEWLGGSVELGLKTTPSNLVEYSRFIIKNLAGGTTKSTQKTAGGSPSTFLIEEIGKFDWKKSYLAAKPSFETKSRWKCVPIAVGTGGEASLSGDAMNALSNPSTLNFLEMDWDKFESKIPDGGISWDRRMFATFVPAQMSYKTGLRSIQRPFGDFLGIKSTFLNKIIIHQSDWIHNLKVLMDDRKKVEGDNILTQQEIVQYPIDPKEVFLSADISVFVNVIEEARNHMEHLIQTGKWDRRRTLTKDINGKITSSLSNKELVEFPFKGGNQDAPYLIIEEPDQEKSPKYYYIASGDFYKQETTTTTDSVGTISIYKFPIFGDESGKKLVASYAARPKTYREFNDNVLLLLEYYSAVFFPENEDLGVFQTYLENKHLEEVYLEKHIDFNSALSYSEGDARKYGWTPKQSKRRLLAMYATYLKEPVKITNDYGEEVEIMMVQTIDDIHLLTEIINYSESGNFDRISGHIGAIGFLHFLEKNYIYPKGVKRKVNEQEPQKLKQERPRQFFSQTGRNRSFFSNRR